jgi:hypothetical protein
MRIRSVLKHSTMAVLEGALVASLVVGLMAGTALAGKPTGGGGGGGGGHHKPSGSAGTIALRFVSDVNGDHIPNFGDTVTFDAATSATPEPHVRLQCFQGGNLVYSAEAGMYPSYPWPWEQNMTLSSSWWLSGAADCTAQIFYFSGSSTVWGTSLPFGVAA